MSGWLDITAAASQAYSDQSPFNSPFINNANFSVGSNSSLDARDSGVSSSGAVATATPTSTATAAKGPIYDSGGVVAGAPGIEQTSSFLWILVGAAFVYVLLRK